MATLPALRVAMYLLVYDGVAALYLSGLLGHLGALVVAALVTASWWHQLVRDRILATPRGSQAVLILAALASVIDLLYLADSVLNGLLRLLLFLVLYRLFMRRGLRDVRDVGFLSFFMLVVAAPVTFSMGFLGVFLAFLVLGTWMLMLYHVLAESARSAEGGGPAIAEAGLGWNLFGLSLGASSAIFGITAVLFFIIPRVDQATSPFRAHGGRTVSGFSERVELGAFGEIELDPAVIMRVRLVGETGNAEGIPNLRWRGIAFDRFDGQTWSVGHPERAVVRRSAFGQFDLGPVRGGGPLLTQEIYLEPMGTEVLFGAPRMLRVGVRADALTVDDMGSVSVPATSTRIQYVVQSELETGPGRDEEPPTSLSAPALERYLQLPPLSPRIAELAREVTAGSRRSAEAARRLNRFLSSGFKYTTVLARQTALDPLEEFLFVRRSGNCEYFAAALAVMLRTVGIPARVVNGFQRGEWNPYGRYFMVRLRDAHSWVEAYLGGGWVTLDPSPRVGGELLTEPPTVALYLDALRVRWYRYVINWSLQDQVVAALRIQRATSTWRPRAFLRRQLVHPSWTTLGGLALALILTGVALWLRGHPPGPGIARRVPRFYDRALRTCARRGFRPDPGETAREFCRRVAAAAPASAMPLGCLTTAYERVRFGAGVLPVEAAAELDRCLADLPRTLSAPSPP